MYFLWKRNIFIELPQMVMKYCSVKKINKKPESNKKIFWIYSWLSSKLTAVWEDLLPSVPTNAALTLHFYKQEAFVK